MEVDSGFLVESAFSYKRKGFSFIYLLCEVKPAAQARKLIIKPFTGLVEPTWSNQR